MILERDRIAKILFSFAMHEAFELGYFHADPHPGNLCLLGDGSIGIIDFGIVGYIGREFQDSQIALLSAIQVDDIDAAFLALNRLLPPDANVEQFRELVERNFQTWLLKQYQPNLSTVERGPAQLLLANFQAARDCGLAFTAPVARYYRTFIILDSVIASLSSTFDHRRELQRYFRDRATRLYSDTINRLLSAEGQDIGREGIVSTGRFLSRVIQSIDEDMWRREHLLLLQNDQHTRRNVALILRIIAATLVLFGIGNLLLIILGKHYTGKPIIDEIVEPIPHSLQIALIALCLGVFTAWAARYIRIRAFDRR